MSVDDRLRQGLGANATSVRAGGGDEPGRRTSSRPASTPRTDGTGGRPGRGRRSMPRPSSPSPCEPGVPDDRSPAPSVTAPSPTAELFSSYEADVTRPQRLAGRWGLELRGNGSAWSPRPTATPGVVSGTMFTADRARLRINLFAQDVCADLGNGEYAWSREGDRLVLAVSNDSCEARTRFFSDNEWVEVSQP